MHSLRALYNFVMEWSLRELHCFVTAVEAGSFTDAGIKLGVSQASVSRTIANFEKALGDRVLRRARYGCEPTALGEALLPQARRILGEVSRLDEFTHSRRSELRLGYAWAAIGRHTVPLLRSWDSIHREISLHLVRHNSATAGLAEGLCDVAIMRTPPDERRFDSAVVGLERRLVAFASDDALWARRRSLRMSEIAERTIITDPQTGTTTSELWSSPVDPVRFVESGDVDEWLDAIAAGVGVGTTAEATATHHPRIGVTYRPITDGPRVPVHLSWWREDPPSGVNQLVETISNLYETHSSEVR